ncbi:MAG: TRAP transporter fused permease subunit [Tissierellia bacterium]|nr:TRAP transporter fused permease subunit [Tissierellia bacterium]
MVQHQRITKFWKVLLLVFTIVGLIITVNQIFMLRLFNVLLLDTSFLYYLIALFLPFTFIIYPNNRKVAWYDIVFFMLSLSIGIYLGIQGKNIVNMSWEWICPPLPTVFSVILWFLVLEAVRRSVGKTLATVCLIFSLYPLVASYLPGFLYGVQFDFLTLARMHIIGRNSILGIPMNVFGRLLIGFLFFGTVLKNTGGGDFFLNLAFSLFGRFQGGAAKVACISSAMLGSMSGSVISNVVTTGSMSIPAMKKSGYSSHYAGAIEACASTGAMIMPPVMGAAAFVMATIMEVPYATIVSAAVIPALLYYWGMFIQIDCYAKKHNLQGLPKEQIPSLLTTLKNGWYYIFAFILLIYLLAYLRIDATPPYYAALALILLSSIKAESRLNWDKAIHLLEDLGKNLTMILSIVTGVGLILGALSITGVALAFSKELISFVGNNHILILISGALTSFILGMGMDATACYIFLAIVMAPALVSLGFNQLCSHLFIFYWGMISYITPPLALAVYAASAISKSDVMKTGWTAVRMGIVAYIIPFCFVYNPALIAQGSLSEIIYTFIFALAGVFLIASGLEGYVVWAGKIPNLWLRITIIISGGLILIPEIKTSIAGCVVGIILLIIAKKKNEKIANLIKTQTGQKKAHEQNTIHH